MEANPPTVFGAVDQTSATRLALTIALSIAIFCASAVGASKLYPGYHIGYDPGALASAAAVVAVFAPVFLLFVLAEFSFGYLIGFYLAAMVVGYLWLSFFTLRSYDLEMARISAAVSGIVFLLPVLFVSSPLPRIGDLSIRSFDRLLVVLFLVCLATLALAATYNFTLVSLGDASNVRTDPFPPIVKYLIGITSSSLLPFLFAYCVARRAFWQAGAIVVLMLCYYPVAVSKTAFFAPIWVIVMSVLFRIVGARMAVVLSLLLPISAGVLLFFLIGGSGVISRAASAYFFNVNFRVLAVPSLALDLYYEFFSRHELTHFCQIRVLKRIIDCPYQEQLGIVMQNYFPEGGTYNGSLFATEGIASVGWLYAPITIFLCGFVIALGNRASAGLPASFVLVSGAVFAHLLLNIPLSTVLLSHGGAFLFMLWYLMPRDALPASSG
jgi:hypothetical protein